MVQITLRSTKRIIGRRWRWLVGVSLVASFLNGFKIVNNMRGNQHVVMRTPHPESLFSGRL